MLNLFYPPVQAVIYARAKEAKQEAAKESEIDDTQVDLALERAKYQAFWVGVNRGIYIDSKNPKVLDEAASHRHGHGTQVISNISEWCSRVLFYFVVMVYREKATGFLVRMEHTKWSSMLSLGCVLCTRSLSYRLI
jgi:hypothetical protein